MELLDALRSLVHALPPLAKFAIGMAIIVGVPPLARRVGIPEMVGFLLFGVVLGPHVLGFFDEHRPIADFFAELGKLLLMFSAGLEVDVDSLPQGSDPVNHLRLGHHYCALAPRDLVWARLRICHYSRDCRWVTARVPYAARSIDCPSSRCHPARTGNRDDRRNGFLGHTIADRVRDLRSDLHDWLLADRACHPAHGDRRLRSAHPLRAQSRRRLRVEQGAGQRRRRIRPDARQSWRSPAWLPISSTCRTSSGRSWRDWPSTPRSGNARRRPNWIFSAKPYSFPASSLRPDFSSILRICRKASSAACLWSSGIIATLVLGKWIAATVVGRAFGYTPAARMTIWALTLPQVAATLAATLVAYHTVNADGQRMLDEKMLNAVLVLMLATSILGPVLTERFAPRMLDAEKEHPSAVPRHV